LALDSGTLYVVSTPIGNLEDITARALRVLKESDIVAAEDTRRTGSLLSANGISSRMTSFNAHNSKQKTPGLVAKLKEGKSIALVSDSGTPGISDPGAVLISEAIKDGVKVTAVPGPTAAIAALVVSGRPANKFVFEGFLSSKSSRRKKQFEELRGEGRTIIFYESPHRIVSFLKDLFDVYGDREVVVAREMTKKFEEIKRGPVRGIIEDLENRKPRGEFTVVL
jgi:16S rRNA (cytidine1402-2'-O)-methyltransferase